MEVNQQTSGDPRQRKRYFEIGYGIRGTHCFEIRDELHPQTTNDEPSVLQEKYTQDEENLPDRTPLADDKYPPNTTTLSVCRVLSATPCVVNETQNDQKTLGGSSSGWSGPLHSSDEHESSRTNISFTVSDAVIRDKRTLRETDDTFLRGKNTNKRLVTMATRCIQSASTPRPKLLYLRDIGACNKKPLRKKKNTPWNSGMDKDAVSKVWEVTNLNERDLDMRVTRGYFFPLTGGANRNSRRISRSAVGKKRYLEDVVQNQLSKKSPDGVHSGNGSRLFHSSRADYKKDSCRAVTKPKSAPQLRNRPDSANIDAFIANFEWNRMSNLRRRKTEGKLTEVQPEFRHEVEKKKSRAKRLLLIVTRIYMAILHWSHVRTVRTAAELQWFTLHSSSEAKTLAFNKALFTKEMAQAKVPYWAVELMQKSAPERSDKDCRKLHALMRGLKAFEKFTERIQLAMCRSLAYQHIDSGRIVLRKGHIGLNFYFIYSGSVFVNVDDVNVKGEKFVRTEVILSRGTSFGELALLHDIKRTATVAVRETCELLIVDKEVFSTLCPQIFDKELEEKVAFLKTVPLFQGRWWSEEAIRAICLQGKIQEYKTNKVIVADSTVNDWMHICMEGKCKIIKYLQIEGVLDDEKGAANSSLMPEAVMDILSPEANDHGGGRDSSHKNRSRMLQSMDLAYISSQQDKDEVVERRPAHEEEAKKILLAHEPVTITGLINQTMQQSDHKDFVFLDIGTLNKGDVFDLHSIVNRQSRKTDSKLILVSGGATILRIKQSDFFHEGDEDSLQHALNIASKKRYPSDLVLLKSYKEKEDWDHYKLKVVKEVLDFKLDGDGACDPKKMSAKQVELEDKTKRLLTAFSKRTKEINGGSFDQEENRHVHNISIDPRVLGAFILGVQQPKSRKIYPSRSITPRTEGSVSALTVTSSSTTVNGSRERRAQRIPALLIN